MKTKLLSILVLIIFVLINIKCTKSLKLIDIGSESIIIDWEYTDMIDPLSHKNEQDKNGLFWFNINYSDSRWKTMGRYPILIDEGAGCNNCDRFYRGTFNFNDKDFEEEDLILSFASDDGIWIHLNDYKVGHWGGEIHKQGCVNRPNTCVENKKVADRLIPIKYFNKGKNIICIHVSQSIGTQYLYSRLSKPGL